MQTQIAATEFMNSASALFFGFFAFTDRHTRGACPTL